MRIIAGLAKGRTLSSVAGATRPTSDRAREGLFSSLLSEFGDFVGLNFLDLFAGSGAIGLEALSRGAALVHAVEKDELAMRTIRTNAELVSKSGALGDFHAYAMPVQKFLEGVSPDKYDIIYIDPPYEFADSDLNKCLQLLFAGDFLKPGSVVAVERGNRSEDLNWPTGLEPMRQRKYGQALIHYAKLTAAG
ncbi:MAG: 16S rRNA (guanine(966)-N(2))-methyltransferase RsmD [Actinobacteria bacterium]|nr:16S rRNA (guanine(966)-N(2))-methyltransferase RsmD [Actinomycetota bacterium]